MRVPSVRSQGSVSINMTPMIDVVFLLIIFFLVSSHLAKQENNIELDLPSANSTLPVDEERVTVTVNVLPNGDWLLGGAVVDFNQLRTGLQKRNAAAGNRLRVKIRADQSVQYEKVKPILLACANAKIGQPIFAVYDPKTKK